MKETPEIDSLRGTSCRWWLVFVSRIVKIEPLLLVSRLQVSKLRILNFATLKPRISQMRRTVVDDVQGSCYYQTVPRVKSGLPVYGSPVGCATCAGDRLRENLG